MRGRAVRAGVHPGLHGYERFGRSANSYNIPCTNERDLTELRFTHHILFPAIMPARTPPRRGGGGG